MTDATAMLNMFQAVSANPMLAQAFDLVRIFKHVAKLSGARNVNDFVMMSGQQLGQQLRTVPDEEALQALDKGQGVRV